MAFLPLLALLGGVYGKYQRTAANRKEEKERYDAETTRRATLDAQNAEERALRMKMTQAEYDDYLQKKDAEDALNRYFGGGGTPGFNPSAGAGLPSPLPYGAELSGNMLGGVEGSSLPLAGNAALSQPPMRSMYPADLGVPPQQPPTPTFSSGIPGSVGVGVGVPGAMPSMAGRPETLSEYLKLIRSSNLPYESMVKLLELAPKMYPPQKDLDLKKVASPVLVKMAKDIGIDGAEGQLASDVSEWIKMQTDILQVLKPSGGGGSKDKGSFDSAQNLPPATFDNPAGVQLPGEMPPAPFNPPLGMATPGGGYITPQTPTLGTPGFTAIPSAPSGLTQNIDQGVAGAKKVPVENMAGIVTALTGAAKEKSDLSLYAVPRKLPNGQYAYAEDTSGNVLMAPNLEMAMELLRQEGALTLKQTAPALAPKRMVTHKIWSPYFKTGATKYTKGGRTWYEWTAQVAEGDSLPVENYFGDKPEERMAPDPNNKGKWSTPEERIFTFAQANNIKNADEARRQWFQAQTGRISALKPPAKEKDKELEDYTAAETNEVFLLEDDMGAAKDEATYDKLNEERFYKLLNYVKTINAGREGRVYNNAVTIFMRDHGYPGYDANTWDGRITAHPIDNAALGYVTKK